MPKLKSSRNRRRRQAKTIADGYNQLEGKWLTYLNVASRFANKAQAEDREDLLHDIIITLADTERDNKPLTEVAMYRLASYTVAHYWYRHYKITQGLDCGHCSREQRQRCREHWLYPECPKAIKVESLSKPIVDDDGNLTELGELIADDRVIDLDAWLDAKTFLKGYPQRLIEIANKLENGTRLEPRDKMYLQRFRQREQKRLF